MRGTESLLVDSRDQMRCEGAELESWYQQWLLLRRSR